jgi:hypothetical protein
MAKVAPMATGETGFDDDVTFGLISFEYHSLKAGHDYGQYVRDAENAGLKDITQFFRQTTDEDPARAARCHELIRQVGGSDHGGTGNALNSARQSPGFLRCEAARACSRRDDGPGHARLRPIPTSSCRCHDTGLPLRPRVR